MVYFIIIRFNLFRKYKIQKSDRFAASSALARSALASAASNTLIFLPIT
jgi:hypothetical protein